MSLHVRLLVVLAVAAPMVAFAPFVLSSERTIKLDCGPPFTFSGLCRGWKSWKTQAGDLWVGCPGQEPPEGAVELRQYYLPGQRLIDN